MRLSSALSSLVMVAIAAAMATAQTPRPVVRIDDPLLAEQPNVFPVMDSEGADRVIAWDDERNGERDIYVSVSRDHGRSWSQEVKVTEANTNSAESSRVKVGIANGVIHVLYRAEYGFANSKLEYRRSTDYGQTWSDEVELADGVVDSRLAVHEDRLVALYRDGVSARGLISRWSTDKGLSFGSEQVVDPLNQGQYFVLDFTVAIVPFSGSAVAFYKDNRLGEHNLYLANTTPGASFWGDLGRVDGDTQGVGTPDDLVVRVQGLDVHLAWHERGRPGSNNESAIFYRSYKGGAFQSEQRLGQYTFGRDDANFPRMEVNDDLLTIIWRDNRSGRERPYLVVSYDDGVSFSSDVTIPARPQSTFVEAVDVAIDGQKIFFVAGEHQFGTGNDELPVSIMSGDGGLNWSDPFDWELPTAGMDEIWFGNDAIAFEDNKLSFAWGGRTQSGDEIRASGIGFPIVDYQQIVGGAPKGVLSLEYADPSQAGQLARWAASTAMGQVVHPENPSLFLDLAPSGIYNQSLAKANTLTAVIQADGSAQTPPIPIKPGLVGKQVFIQGWVNENGVGQAPSEVILATL